jgi:hypothetical protein
MEEGGKGEGEVWGYLYYSFFVVLRSRRESVIGHQILCLGDSPFPPEKTILCVLLKKSFCHALCRSQLC